MTAQLLRIPEAAARLGVSKDSVYRLISTGELRAVAGPGGRTRVVEADLETYVESLAPVGIAKTSTA